MVGGFPVLKRPRFSERRVTGPIRLLDGGLLAPVITPRLDTARLPTSCQHPAAGLFKRMRCGLIPATAGGSERQLRPTGKGFAEEPKSVSYTHLRAHETRHDLVCRLLLEK